VPERRAYTDAEIDAAVAELREPERLETAQRVVAHSASQLQGILDEAMDAGGWFGPAHQEQVLKAAGIADPDQRLAAVRTLVAEESRIAMLVGVAVGMELAHTLIDNHQEE
jgi:hypothetical protein